MSLYKILVIFLLVNKCEGTVNPYGPTVVRDYANCISTIIENEFNEPGLLIFANTNNVSTSVSNIRTVLLKRLHETMNFSVEIMSPGKEVEICDKDNYNLGVLHVDTFVAIPSANYFIIIIDSYTDFSYLASKLIRSRSWNPFAKFIILLFNYVRNDKINIEYVEKVLSCLFKYNAINIVIAVPQASNVRNAIIYSWRPYDPPKYCGYFNETAKDRLVAVNTCERGRLKYNNSVFEDKVPYDMNGCVMEILALQRQPFISDDEQYTSIEKIMIDRMLKRFKMKAHYHFLEGFRGERENVGEWNGALKKLSSKTGQLLLGGIFPDFDVHEDFETTTTYLADVYTWVVPRAPKSAPWVALVFVFKRLVWYSVIVCFVLCGIAWTVIGRLSGESPYNKSLFHCFLNTWITTMGFVTYLHPKKDSLRVYFVFLNMYCILFSAAYQTQLFDVLTRTSYDHQMNTVQELVDSGIKFGGYEELHDLFYNSTDPFDNLIGEKWVDIENITDALINVAVYRNFSLLCSKLELKHISAVTPALSDNAGNYNYHTFSDNVFNVPIETIALRGFPFMLKFSTTITIFKQSGLNEGLRHQFTEFTERRRARQLRDLLKEKSDVSPLTAKHLQGGFFALFLGYVSGIFTLIAEVLVNTGSFKKKFAQCKRKLNFM
ncbi:uncharacterized protein LOC118268540 [Spodoptera frugiperda]|uniref:Uncharacterized protein LOC118268540 n=1 Tax=Spodoptera frugiperda TaxID=7108 RepID=A0A9R0D3L6_SPOFR|nr:uncharacterized protein LOC118268540 [Spodoptera frugiperda]